MLSKKDLKDKLEDIVFWLPRAIRRLKRRIKIIWHWLPIIWNDNDYDYYFILIVLRHKIKRTRIYVDKAQRHIGYEKTVKNMRYAELMLSRFIDFEPAYLNPLGFCECPEDTFTWENGIGTNHICNYCAKVGIKLKHNQENQNWKDLFTYLEKHMQRWWD